MGHAAELLTDGGLRYGFAIGIGMLAAAPISVEMGYLDRDEEAAHQELLVHNSAPTELPANLDVESVMGAVRLDNKRGYVAEEPGACELILLDGLGCPHHTVHDRRRNFGAISNDVHELGITRNLVGGTGTCRWKQLINGMHLEGGWHCVEYVVIPPGASCGRHVHASTERSTTSSPVKRSSR